MAGNHGYLGRAPGDSSIRIARQTYSVTGSTTEFTFASGYDVGFIDVYLNGSKLITNSDYTASNGSTVTLITAAETDDIVEIVAYKAFNVGTVDSANGNFTVGGNLTVDGTAILTGGIDLRSIFQEKCKITAGKLSDNLNIDLADGMVHHFTTQETTTATPNIRVDSSTTLDSQMSVGDIVSVTIITTAAAAGYSDAFTIDGNSNGVGGYTIVTRFVGGTAPTTGGSSGNDIYALQIIKTASSTFTIIVNLTNAA